MVDGVRELVIGCPPASRVAVQHIGCHAIRLGVQLVNEEIHEIREHQCPYPVATRIHGTQIAGIGRDGNLPPSGRCIGPDGVGQVLAGIEAGLLLAVDELAEEHVVPTGVVVGAALRIREICSGLRRAIILSGSQSDSPNFVASCA